MHVYVKEHIFSLCPKTAWWMFMKLDRGDGLHVDTNDFVW